MASNSPSRAIGSQALSIASSAALIAHGVIVRRVGVNDASRPPRLKNSPRQRRREARVSGGVGEAAGGFGETAWPEVELRPPLTDLA